MDRKALRSVVAALVGVVAVGVAAAAFGSTTTVSSGGTTGLGGKDQPSVSLFDPLNMSTEAISIGIRIPPGIFAIVALVSVVAVAIYAIIHWQESITVIVVGIVLIAMSYLLSWLLSLGPFGFPGASSPGLFGTSGGGIVETAPDTPPEPSVALLLGVVLVGSVIALLGMDEGEGTAREGRADEVDPEVAAIGRTAGRIADEIETGAAIDNEVYRAWNEMTELLDVADPETKAPGEFAAAAIEAGMDPDDVRELTALFEVVRYGDDEPTEEYERRAVGVLRRIEGEYTER